MSRPKRNFGMTDAERQKMCERKDRYSDEHAAAAGAMRSLENHNSGYSKLWTYKCPVCRGWHCTKKKINGREPITVPVKNEAVK